MATYFHGGTSEINNSSSSPSPHADGLQTLYLMNPNNYHAPYSDAPHHHTPPTPNMLLLNPNAPPPHALNLAHLSHAPPLPSPNQHQHQHLANILASANSEDHSRPSLFGPHEITAAFHGFSPAPRVHYNLWGSVVDQTQQSSAAATPSSSSAGGGDVSPQMDFRRPSQQGLSLSLSSQQQRTVNYRSLSGEIVGNSPSSASNGISSVQSVILGSKYLKAAQELLDEVVNVGNNNKKEELGEKVKGNRESNSGGVGDGSSGGGGGENSDAGGKHVAELTTAQRQELQMKKSKLVSMLDEVEQRYRQYHQQMQIVVSSFEQAAGYGAAKSYTALALKTISKQFRCLKDAISSQIRGTSKTLGEEDPNCLGVKVMEGGSRLRYVDHHLRQQRALQQLGMIQPNAWRPQRGLPERAVSILRAWLFEHFLHPYPKDSDKVMLAKQTGLTRSQVSNWFINARVRLWKPMVEEMYLEETKEQEHKNNSNNMRSTSNNPTDESGDVIKLDQIKIPQSNQQEIFFNHQNTSASPTEISGNSSMSTSPNMGGGGGGFHLVGVGSSDKAARRTITTTSEIMLNSPSSILSVDMEIKHHHNHTNHNNKFIGIIDQSHTKDGYPLMTGISPNHGGGGGGFGGFSMEDMIGSSRFNNNVTDHQLASSTRFQGNSVSLTLGLPHNNNENLSISGTPPPHQQHAGFLSQNIHNLGRRLEIGGTNNNNGNNEFCVINTAPPPSHSASYETTIDIQNTKRFAAQLLPDFVA